MLLFLANSVELHPEKIVMTIQGCGPNYGNGILHQTAHLILLVHVLDALVDVGKPAHELSTVGSVRGTGNLGERLWGWEG